MTTQDEQIQQLLAQIRALRDVLGEDAIAPLRARVAELQRRTHVETEGGAYVGGNVDSGGGNIHIGDIVLLAAERYLDRLRAPAQPENLRAATEAYLQYLLDRYRYLSLKGMGVTDRVPLRLPLLDLYVPLKARREMPEGETWRRAAQVQLAGRALDARRLSEPQPLLALLQENDGLIILGDPGAGKTTFLKMLALRLARGEGEDNGLGVGRRLPVLVPLSAYANALAEGDVRLDDFIAAHFHTIGADLPIADLLSTSLAQGAALVLLDGLDEVKNLGLRDTVVERVLHFYTLHRRAGNKFVLTSRIVGYREVRPDAQEGLAECTLVDFDDAEIEAFVARWTVAMETQATGAGAVAQADAALERRELLDAIARNAGVRRLAANPLLLTILALMKRQGVTLPERRVQLYDQYVATLLSSWNRARGLGRPPTRDLDVVQTVRILAPLALWMHEVAPGVGLVKREALRRRLEAIYAARGEDAPEAAARRFLADVREHAGLLLERGAGTYGFIHLTFEEYLAAVAIALRGQGDCRPIVAHLRAHVGDPAWREVALLTVAYVGIVQQLDYVAGEVVEALACDPAASCAEAVVLAGEAVLDAGESGVPPASRARVVEALVRTMQDAETEARLRQRAGWVLGRLGWQPEDLDTFVWVPRGPFLYGDGQKERVIQQPYGIGKYPVTNLQYARFIEDGGYTCRAFWSDKGWAWREEEGRMRPAYWDNVELNNPIFPVVGITYYEAEAYCAWLTAKLAEDTTEAWVVEMRTGLEDGVRQTASVKRDPRGLTFVVRLPSEEEWERAARGTDGRTYPWGEGFNPAFANTEESDLKTTTAVCTYPQGVSPVGAWDMSGNVWEWTSSWWDAREKYHVFRGGSWLFDEERARCASRYYNYSFHHSFFVDYGVRVGVSLVDSDC